MLALVFSFPGHLFAQVCTSGKYSPEDGASGCIKCDAGRYQAASGQPYCPGCVPGTYATYNGSSVWYNFVFFLDYN
jgi:hypothetical protein